MNKANNKNSSNQKIWLYGKHAVLAALNNKQRQHLKLLITKSALAEYPEIQKYDNKSIIQIVEIEQIKKVLPEGAIHQNIALNTTMLPNLDIDYILQTNNKASLIVIDQVTDPQNVGAIIRSAAAFGAIAVVAPLHNSPQESGTLAKAASGCLELVPFIKVVNLNNFIAELKEHGFWIVGLTGDGQTHLHEISMPDKCCFILGSEGEGIRPLVQKNSDFLAKLPISSEVESLNVSVAAALALYQYNLVHKL